ncbi:MAG: CPBP family intramembrane metalloprotease [Ruminococcaceae bacterium]|nr:CPBP family intramembrane metalloprotease [Oscillospiraceae bacterium]
MNQCCKKRLWLIITVIISCVVMAFIETIIEPTYFLKSVLKMLFFLFVPILVIKLQKEKVFADSFSLHKKSILQLLGLGLAIYGIIMGAFFLTKEIFDYSTLVNSLSTDQKVSHTHFIWVALYISFGNSLLEEFLFRFVAFLHLSKYTTKKAVYFFSSCLFALYHIAMIGSSFPVPLLLLALVGLAVGGAIFNYVDEKGRTIYYSWIIHMFADFAIMTIWYLHI